LKKICLLAALAWSISAAAQPNLPSGDASGPSNSQSEWEREQEKRDWKETEIRLPAQPKGDALIEFFVSAGSSFRFFIDPASVSVGSDGVVRYTLVARSPSGAENVSYEGIRCSSASYKVYAYGQGAGWSRAQGDWKPIEPKSVQRWHQALRREYFCPFNLQVSTAAEAVDYLRRGGHPDFKQKY
jgi:hypothetical protein